MILLTLHSGDSTVLIPLSQVNYIGAEGTGSRIHFSNGFALIVHENLNEIRDLVTNQLGNANSLTRQD